MAAFQDFKVLGVGGWEWVDGWHEKKNQGEGLGLIRDFRCKINDWAQQQPVEVEGVVQQGCGGQLQVDLKHQDCGPRMFSAGSLQVHFHRPFVAADHESQITGRCLFSWKQ